MLCATSVFLIASIIICNIFPAQNYKRYGWQDGLLKFAENIMDSEGSNGGLAIFHRSEIQLTKQRTFHSLILSSKAESP